MRAEEAVSAALTRKAVACAKAATRLRIAFVSVLLDIFN